VGGHGVTGSADPFQVGVILGYPGERADPFGQEEASAIDASAVAGDVTKLPTGNTEQASLRQPPTVSDTTAAAFLRSTYAMRLCLCLSACHKSEFYKTAKCRPGH